MTMAARGFLAAFLALVAPALLFPSGSLALDGAPAAPPTYLERKVVALDGSSNDFFGCAVAVSGDTAVVGARGDNGYQGSAYIFVRQGGLWVQQAKLTVADGAANDRFGASVSISGDTVLVGASGRTVGTNVVQGAAYVFVRSGGAWTQQATLVAGDGLEYAYFGYSVAIQGSTAVVGADGADAVYVFTRSGTAWNQEAKLVPQDVEPGQDYFGWSVAISGETLIATAPYDVTGAVEHGSAYIFTRSAGGWTEQAKLVASDPKDGAYFGEDAVGIAGGTAVVGAHGAEAAYVFTLGATGWTEQARLVSPTGHTGDRFGWSAAVSGDTVVIGAPLDQDVHPGQGAVYLFTRTGGIWERVFEFSSSDGAANDRFGTAVALQDGMFLAGARADRVGANGNQGSAYFYNPVTSPDVALGAVANTATVPAGGSVILWATAANFGPGDATGLTVVAPLPAGLSLLAQAPSQGTYDPGTGVWDLGTLGEEVVATLALQAAAAGGPAVATLVFSPTTPRDDVNPTNNAASASVTVIPTDVGVLAAAGAGATEVGATVTLTVTARNFGTAAAANGVAVSCPLPAGLSFVSATPAPGSTYDAGTGAWSIATLAAGASATLSLTATVSPAAAGNVLVFTAQAAWGDTNQANNTASVTLPVGMPDLGLLATASTTTPAVGAGVNLTVTLANLGPGSAAGATVSFPLPAGFTFVSAAASRGGYDAATGTWSLGADALAAGTAATLLVQATPTATVAGKTVAFTAQTPWADGNPANNAASLSLAVAAQQLLLNGGMETDSNGDKLPNSWTRSGWAAGDGRTTATRRSGKASVQLAGNGKAKTLQQQIVRTGVQNERLAFAAYAKPASVPAAATLSAELIVYNGATVVLRKLLNFSKGSSGFVKRSVTATVPKASTKIIVKLTYSGASGSVWLDDVSLARTAP